MVKIVTRNELARRIRKRLNGKGRYNELGLEQREIDYVIKLLLDEIYKCLLDGEDVLFSGYFKLYSTWRKGRTYRGIGSAEQYYVPRQRRIKIKMAKQFDDKIKEIECKERSEEKS